MGATGQHDGKPWGHGGGISGGGTITNSTLSNNYAALSGGGIEGGATLGNTILNANTPENIYGGAISHGYNLSSDDGGGNLTGTADQINTDPKLGPLQDNGGPTFTHALLSGSPAIDAGDPAFVGPPDFDQRSIGFPRVQNGRIDIGAFESAARTATMTTADAAAVQYSDVVALHATVSPDTATGSIQFSVGGTPVGSAVAVSGGEAELNVQVLL